MYLTDMGDIYLPFTTKRDTSCFNIGIKHNGRKDIRDYARVAKEISLSNLIVLKIKALETGISLASRIKCTNYYDSDGIKSIIEQIHENLADNADLYGDIRYQKDLPSIEAKLAARIIDFYKTWTRI